MALTDSLISYWKLDGNSTDIVGANSGTDTDIAYNQFESYITTPDDTFGMTNTTQVYSQTFVPTTGYTITSVSLYMSKGGGSGGNINVGIYAVNGNGRPTGSALATGSIAINSISTGLNNISLGAGVALTQGTTYCIRAVNSTNSVAVAWHLKGGVNYGVASYSSDTGATWATWSGTFLFITYGTGNSGKINQGAGFNGTTSKIAATAINIGTDASISAWFKTTQVPSAAYPIIFNCVSYPVNFSMTINNGDGKVASAIRDSNSKEQDGLTANQYNDGNWHFGVLTKQGNTCKLYLDGGAETITLTGDNFTGNFNGAVPRWGSFNGSSDWYSGAIDEVGIWSRALTSGEVASLYNGGAGLAYPLTVNTNQGNMFLVF